MNEQQFCVMTGTTKESTNYLGLPVVITRPIGQLTDVYLAANPLIWSEAEGDLVVIETSI